MENQFNRDHILGMISEYIACNYRPRPRRYSSSDGSVSKGFRVGPEEEVLCYKMAMPSDFELLPSDIEPGKSFYETLTSFIDAKGLKDSDVYNAAGYSRQSYSVLAGKEDKTYAPRRANVLRFCIALHLDGYEAEQLMRSAGLNFQISSKRDLIIKWCVNQGFYDTKLIDQALVNNRCKALFSVE